MWSRVSPHVHGHQVAVKAVQPQARSSQRQVVARHDVCQGWEALVRATQGRKGWAYSSRNTAARENIIQMMGRQITVAACCGALPFGISTMLLR